MFQKADALFLARAMDPVQRAKLIADATSSRKGAFWVSMLMTLAMLITFSAHSAVISIMVFLAAINLMLFLHADGRLKLLLVIDALEKARREPQPTA